MVRRTQFSRVHRTVSVRILSVVPPDNPYRSAPIISEDENADRARLQLERDLDPGEKILWAGLPKQGLYFAASDLALVPFSLMWGGFAFFWEWSVLSSNAPLLFRLWGIPFCCVGLYLIVGRFFYDAYQRTRTFYGVTNRRILILTSARTRVLVSIDIANQAVSLRESRDGSGTLTFGQPVSPIRYGQRRGNPQPPSFQGIANARVVLSKINEAKETLRLPPKSDDDR